MREIKKKEWWGGFEYDFMNLFIASEPIDQQQLLLSWGNPWGSHVTLKFSIFKANCGEEAFMSHTQSVLHLTKQCCSRTLQK